MNDQMSVMNRDLTGADGYFDYDFCLRFVRVIITPVMGFFPFLYIILSTGLHYIGWRFFGSPKVVNVHTVLEMARIIGIPFISLEIFVWMLFIGLAIRYVIWHSPIGIKNNVIEQYIYCIKMRAISKERILNIEKTRKWHNGMKFYYNEISVVSDGSTIKFRDYIVKYDALRSIVNQWIRDRDIPVEFINQFDDAIRLLPTAAQRRQARKSGIRSTLKHL